MGNELGNVIGESLKKAVRKVATPAPERPLGDAVVRAVRHHYTPDMLIRSAEAIRRTTAIAERQAVPTVDKAAQTAVDEAARKAAGAATVRAAGAPARAAGAGSKAASAVPNHPSLGPLVKELPKADAPAEITYVAYGAYKNDLSGYLPRHLNDLETVGTTKAVRIVAVMDGADPASAYKWLIQKDADLNKVVSPRVPAGPGAELNMSDPASLKASVSWGFGDNPSRLKWLDGKDHGAGYFGMYQDVRSLNPMRWPASFQAILDGNGGKPIDVLSFDACQGQTVEVAFQGRKAVGLIVASGDETFPMGMNYAKTLAELNQNPKVDAEGLARIIAKNVEMTGKDIIEAGDVPGVKRVYDISVVNTAKTEDVAAGIKELAQALTLSLPSQRDNILAALKGVKPMYVASHGGFDWNMKDLVSVAEALKQNVHDPAVQAAADKVTAATIGPGGAVIQHAAAPEEAGAMRGLTIYLPLDGKIDPVYEELEFAKVTGWADFLKKLVEAPAVAPVK